MTSRHAAWRNGSPIPSSSGARRSRAASAAWSSPTSTPVAAACTASRPGPLDRGSLRPAGVARPRCGPHPGDPAAPRAATGPGTGAAGVRKLTVGLRALRLDARQHLGEPRLPLRHLDAQQPRQRPRQLELVLQTQISMPGPTHPYRCQYRPMNTSLCARYARYNFWGGCGLAPSSNITGLSRNAEMARDTARRSSASSPRGELTNTRRRRSGVRITSSLGSPSLPDRLLRGSTPQASNEPAPQATRRGSQPIRRPAGTGRAAMAGSGPSDIPVPGPSPKAASAPRYQSP
jgi:hypothetical protein